MKKPLILSAAIILAIGGLARSVSENPVVGPRASGFVTGKDGQAGDIGVYRRYSRTQSSRKTSRSKPDRILRPTPESEDIQINRSAYADRLHGFWLGQCIANWTGLKTENARTEMPFFTDMDWGEVTDYVLDQDPWGADDDTDIEYIYQHAMEAHQYKLTGKQIAQEWKDHISLPRLWVSNLAALGQMQNGAIPPETSLPENNPMWEMIDAQLTTEIFGTFAPGRPDVALDLAQLPIRTTAYLHSEWASEFYVIMHSLAPAADPTLSMKEQTQWLAERARRRIPDWSYIADMYDFVKSEYEKNPDKEDRETTRNKVYQRYQKTATAGYDYRYPWDSGINFAASIVSLLYGEGNYKKTIRIGSLCGWDADNPTATWGGLLGFMMGREGIEEHFNKTEFSAAYRIARSRRNMPIPTDDFQDMATRAIRLIDQIVAQEMGGCMDGDNWVIPDAGRGIKMVGMKKIVPPWTIIEDNDKRWEYDRFITQDGQWNASGATLTSGQGGSIAQIAFEGTAVQYYAYRDTRSGGVTVFLDGNRKGTFSLKNQEPQYYVKIWEESGLEKGSHVLKIIGDESDAPITIDMLQVIEGE
jgi:hypothetical protein